MRKPLSQYRSFHATVLAVSLGLLLAGCRWFPPPHHGPGHPPGTTTTVAPTTWPGSTTTASWPSSTTTTRPGPTTTTTLPCPGEETTTTESPSTLPPTTNTTRLPNSTTTSWPATTIPPSTTTTSWPATTFPPTTDTTWTDTTDTTDPDTTDTTGYGTGGIVFELTVLIDDCPAGLLPLIDGGVCQESEEYSCTSLDANGFTEITGFGSSATIHVFPTDPSIICPDTTFVRDYPDWNFDWQWLTVTCTRA